MNFIQHIPRWFSRSSSQIPEPHTHSIHTSYSLPSADVRQRTLSHSSLTTLTFPPSRPFSKLPSSQSPDHPIINTPRILLPPLFRSALLRSSSTRCRSNPVIRSASAELTYVILSAFRRSSSAFREAHFWRRVEVVLLDEGVGASCLIEGGERERVS